MLACNNCFDEQAAISNDTGAPLPVREAERTIRMLIDRLHGGSHGG